MTALRAGVADVEAFRTMLSSRGIALDTIRTDADGSLRGAVTLPAETAAPTVRATAADEGLDVGALLGRGGMGEVHAARQRSLRREVAVKTVLERGNYAAEMALLKEAWAGGALEHPSVVPVHTLTRIDGGAAVVMKRIAGTSWSSLIDAPGSHPRFHGDGAVEAHLRVLVQVCHAIAFAHERGILHLDLKPENVMVGELGEVYVLDWGLAAALATGPDWLPRTTSIPLPAGTPGYMAPELAGGEQDRIGPATDVYLLGAMLHHVVTGRMRHVDDTLFTTLLRAYRDDPPTYGPDVPRGLAEILTRAMQRDVAARYTSADAMRIAIEDYLRHRPAEHFMTRAHEALDQLETRLTKAEKGDPEIEPLLAECEMALTEVRREWAEHPGLADAEQASIARRAMHAVLEERLPAARALAAELASVPEPLAHAIDALDRRIAERDRYERGLEQMMRELDLTLGSAERRRIFAVFGAVWAIVSIAIGTVHRTGFVWFGYTLLFAEGVALFVSLSAFAWLQRDKYLANRANRRLWGGLAFIAFAVETFFGVAGLARVPVQSAIAMSPVIYAFGFGAVGLALERRMLAGVPPLVLAAIVAACWPSYAYDVVGVGGGLAAFAVLWAWSVSPVRGSA